MGKKHEAKNLFVIDSLAIVFRAYHAIPVLKNKGQNLNAVYGFFSIFLKILNSYDIDYLVCTFDSKSASDTRKEKFNWYKANRGETPEDLIEQIIILKKILSNSGIPLIEKERFEADDIIATISNTFIKNDDVNIYIVTGDKDLLQLVDKNIYIIMPSKTFSDPNIIQSSNVLDYLGFENKYLNTYKALMGDSSDNIPGVQGIGDKGAKTLINEFGDIYNIYNNISNIKESIASKLLEYKKDAFDSYEAANLVFNVDLEKVSLDDFHLNINTQFLIRDFEEYGFQSLIKKYFPTFENIPEDINSTKEFKKVNNVEDFKILEKAILNTKKVYFLSLIDKFDKYSIETKPSRLILSVNEDTFYINLDNIDENISKGLKAIFVNKHVLKIGYDIKLEKHLLYNIDIAIEAPYFDTQIASFVCLGKVLRFQNMVFETLGISLHNIDVHKGGEVNDLITENYINNMAGVTSLFQELYKYFEHILNDDKKLNFVFYNINSPLIDIIFNMERRGVLINTDYLDNLYKGFGNRLNDISKKIFNLSNVQFNILSPGQLSDVLFNRLKIPVNIKRTKTGRIATDSITLSEISHLDSIIPLILKYKELSKIKSTYTKSLSELAYPDNRLHTTYGIVGTSTGRLTSSSPNLQNVPIKTEIGRMIRKAFISSEQSTLFSFDYSQIELRILSFYAKDKVMINAFLNDQDIHLYTAAIIFNKDNKDVSKDERNIAKTINFGIIYGLSSFGLSRQLHISRAQASKFIDDYFDTFRGIKKYYEYIIDFLEKHSFTETIYGTRRVFDMSQGYSSKSRMLREAINMPIQGSSADIIKIAMNNIYNNVETKYPAYLVLQIHDELIFEISDLNDYTLFVKDVVKYMTDFDIGVPLKIDIKNGKNWKDLKIFKYNE